MLLLANSQSLKLWFDNELAKQEKNRPGKQAYNKKGSILYLYRILSKVLLKNLIGRRMQTGIYD